MTLPDSLDKWINVVTIVVLGGFTAFNIWSKKSSESKELADAADDRLITLLKTTVDALEKKVKELEQKFTDTLVELTKIRSERDTLASVLQGRDSASTEMGRLAGIAMKNVDDILNIVKDTNRLVKDLKN